MKRTTKVGAALPSVLVTAALLTACGEDTPAAGGSCAGSEVTVGITNSSSDAPLYIADEKGYFKDEGLSVKLQPFDSAAKMIAPLGSGQLDVGAGAPSAGFYNAVGRDLPIRIVADKGSMPEHYGYMPLLVRKDLVDSGKVGEIADLKGRTVAEPAQATATSSTLGTMLGSADLTYDDVKHEYIGFAEHVTAFQNGAIDAALTTEPSATVAEERGVAERLATPPDFYDQQQLAVLLYSGTFAEEEKAVGTCFMAAYLRGARDYMSAFENGKLREGERSDEVVDIVTEAVGLEPALYRKIVPNYVDPDGQVNVESLRKDYTFFKDQGLLQADVDVDGIVDPSFATAAVGKLGEYQQASS